MPKTKYKVALPDGTFATRTSDRVYTHVVVARRNYRVDLERAAEVSATDESNFDYFTKIATGRDPHPTKYWRTEPKWTAEEVAEEKARVDAYNAERVANAATVISAYTSATEYAKAKMAERVAKIEADKAKGLYDQFDALAWCGRPDLAAKEVTKRSGYWVDVQAVEVK